MKMQFYLCALLFCVCVQSIRTAVIFPSLLRYKRNPQSAQTKNPPKILCGIETRSPNPIHRNPWLAFIEYQGDEMIPTRCAGTLIDERHVVTAAHCVTSVDHTGLKVRLGEYDVTTAKDCVDEICSDAVITINVTRTHTSPKYDGFGGDIAVLVLEEAAPYTDFIRPICLPSPSAQINEQVNFFAAGWGEVYRTHTYSNVKKLIPLPSWKNEDCNATYAYYRLLPEDIICAGGVQGMDTCNGDSGGPLVLYQGDQAVLWGVTCSGTMNCGAKGYPGMYTNVKLHLDWIFKVTGQIVK